MQLIKLLPVLLLGGLLACQKPTDAISPNPGGQADSLSAIPTAIGKPIGAPVTQTIGPAGGTIAMPNGKLTLSFPAGTVKKETAITVQPGENNAPNGVGQAFSISPNVTFEQDVTVIYYYQDNEMDGAAVDALGIAYQDGRQAWQRTQTAKADKAKKTVTAKLKKGSWWALITPYQLEPEQATVAPGETKELTLMKLKDWEPSTNGDVTVAPVLMDKVNNDVAKLYINGVDWTSAAPKDQSFGSVGQNRQTGAIMYIAPSQKPQKNPVIITVEIKNPTSNARFLLSSQLAVGAENSLTIDGHSYNNVVPNLAVLLSNDLLVAASGTDSLGHVGKFHFKLENFSVGLHQLTAGSEGKTATYLTADTGIPKDEQGGVSYYSTCGKPETEKGTVEVVKVEPADNGYLKARIVITGRVVTVHDLNIECQVVKHKTIAVSAALTVLFQK